MIWAPNANDQKKEVTTMEKGTPKQSHDVEIVERQIHDHLGKRMRGLV